jgi:hypothetical protein
MAGSWPRSKPVSQSRDRRSARQVAVSHTTGTIFDVDALIVDQRTAKPR